MARGRHQKKQVEAALLAAEAVGFTVTVLQKGHRYGVVTAPDGDELTVYSTPRDPDVMAKRIQEFVRKHPEEQT